MHFQHPEYFLWLIALIPMGVLYVLYLRWKKQRIVRIGDPALVSQLISSYSQRNFKLGAFLAASAFILLVGGLAGLRKSQTGDAVRRSGMDVMIALDVSQSMLATDVQPNRLERARQLLYRLIDKLPDDRFGMVMFAGKAYLQLPLTTDHAAAKMYLSSVSTDAVPTQGTVLNEALKMCYSGFTPHEKKYRTIIVVSDGEDHDDGAQKTADQLSKAGVIIHTVGIGSPQGTEIKDRATGLAKLDPEGKPVISRLNEELLRKIAQTTGGAYTRFSSAEATTGILKKQLQGMERRNISDITFGNFRLYFQWLLLAALILLIIESLLPEMKRIQPAFLLFCLLTPWTGSSITAQQTLQQIRQGNVLYEKKQYREAAESYRIAAADRTKKQIALYNLGNALYKDNRPDEAVKAYDEAISNGGTNEENGAAWYNKGVVLQQQKNTPGCIEAYKNALRLNPRDEEARLNLQQALRQQQQQQKSPPPPKKEAPQKEQQSDQQSTPPPKMSKREAEEKLRALMQHEKNLQEKLRKVKTSVPEQPAKDW